LYRDNFIDIIRFTTNQILSFLPLDYPPQKRKSPVKSLATIGGALHSLLGFLFAVSFIQEEN